MFVKKFLTITLITILMLCLNGQALAKVYIDIDSPTFRKFPIAIVDLKKLKPIMQRQEDISSWFAESLSKSLDMTGYFNIISKKSFLENTAAAGINLGGIRFSDWSAIGAEYLVKGGFQYNGKEIELQATLFDVIKGGVIVSKTYTGTKENKANMVRQFAAEILLALTGDRGVFDTKIGFISRSGGMSGIYTINFDGSDLSRVAIYPNIALALRWSPDGSKLSFTSYKDGNPDLYVRDLGRGASRKVSGFDGINLSGSWSPDGSKLLMTLSKDGNEEIYVMDVWSKSMKRLTYNFSIDVSPTWSPDGRRIAFVSDRAGSPQIYIMNADGSGVRRITNEGRYNTSPAWSPKGKTIAYEGSASGRYQIFTIDEDGSNKKQITFESGDNESPSWSPDGRLIVFSSRGRGIYVVNADGSNLRRLHAGGSSPFWSPHLK